MPSLIQAGSSVIDHRRTQTEGAATKSAAAQFAEDYGVPNESVTKLPLLWDTELLETPDGTGAGVHGLGAFRQVISSSKHAFRGSLSGDNGRLGERKVSSYAQT